MAQAVLRYLAVTSQYLLDCGVVALNVDLLIRFRTCRLKNVYASLIQRWASQNILRIEQILRFTLSFPAVELNPSRRFRNQENEGELLKHIWFNSSDER